MKVDTQTWVISDFHFGHKRIQEYAGRPDNHEELIIERWNEVVHKHNKALFLGDLSFTNKKNTLEYTNKLKGNKWMVRGNHDDRSETWYRDVGFPTVEAIFKKFKDGRGDEYTVLLTHRPVWDIPNDWYNIHGHVHRGRHRSLNLSDKHFNVSCEVLDYRPIQIYEILQHFGDL